MGLDVAIQMDPMESINISGDSTFVMALEAQQRGHSLWHYLPSQLSLRDGKVTAHARPVQVRRVHGDHFTFGEPERIDLAAMDVVLLRQDPPFDMTYITTTHMLDLVADRALVVNDPTSVRNAPEKLFVTRFAHLTPPTLITGDRAEILDFRAQHRDIIVKPLFGNGGAGVFHITENDENLNALLELFTQISREPLIVQKYLPEVRQGDKRVILVDGEAVGAINRVPAKGEARSNMHVGGRAEAATLTARDREICAAIGPVLREQGLLFVGIDVIDGNLTEINVTSPTGIVAIDRFNGTDTPGMIWDAILKRLSR